MYTRESLELVMKEGKFPALKEIGKAFGVKSTSSMTMTWGDTRFELSMWSAIILRTPPNGFVSTCSSSARGGMATGRPATDGAETECAPSMLRS